MVTQASISNVVEELQTLNRHTQSVSERVEGLVESFSGSGGFIPTLKAFVDQQKNALANQRVRDTTDRLRGAEAASEAQRGGGLQSYLKAAGQSSFIGGVSQGILGGFGGLISTFLGTFLGRVLGPTGILLKALPTLAGRLLGRLGVAGLVLTFGEDVLTGLFKQMRDSGYLFNWSDEQLGEVASNATDGLFAALIAGLVTKNPFIRLGVFITGYFKDEILNTVKWMFGIKESADGRVTANLPFMEEIDLSASMSEIESTITGIMTAVGGLLSLFIAKKFGRIPKLIRRLLGLPTAGAAAGAGAAAAGAGAAAAAGGGAKVISAAQKAAINNLDDAALAGQGLARNTAGQVIRKGTGQIASNADKLNALAAARNPRAASLLSMGKKVPGLGAVISGGLLASILLDDSLDQDQKTEEVGALFGSVLGGVGGAAAGGLIAGAMGLTTGPGAILTGLGGAVVGGFAGDWLGREAAEFLITGQAKQGDISSVPQAVLNDISYSSDMGSDGRLKLYDEFGDYRLLTNVEQNGDMGRLLRGDISRGSMIEKLSADGSIQVINNYYSTDASTNVNSSGGGNSGYTGSNAPLPSRDTTIYDFN